jgi:hypothetical protein
LIIVFTPFFKRPAKSLPDVLLCSAFAVVRPLVQGTIGDYSGKGSPAVSGMNHGTINPIT